MDWRETLGEAATLNQCRATSVQVRFSGNTVDYAAFVTKPENLKKLNSLDPLLYCMDSD